jgi:hypothetical protein
MLTLLLVRALGDCLLRLLRYLCLQQQDKNLSLYGTFCLSTVSSREAGLVAHHLLLQVLQALGVRMLARPRSLGLSKLPHDLRGVPHLQCALRLCLQQKAGMHA